MKINYKPTSGLEKFGVKVYSALVENFPQTFFVGGMVRDLLLRKKITDVDIATQALPHQIVEALHTAGITSVDTYAAFGSIKAEQENLESVITTFRSDLAGKTRYSKIQFTTSMRQDSLRRDFTLNSLYLSLKTGEISDFWHGQNAIKRRQIKFIGNPTQRIKQDPLRIIRALRFALVLNFNLENKTKRSIKNNFDRLAQLTKAKINSEVNKVKDAKKKKILEKVINNPLCLDKYFK